MSKHPNSKRRHHDLFVPLPSTATYPTKAHQNGNFPSNDASNFMSSKRNSSNDNINNTSSLSTSSRKKRQQQAHMYQMRLNQLGYDEVAFAHTTFGRLNTERDDVDVTLPWEDLIPPSLMASKSSDAPAESGELGRTNSLGMKIYRRLNIVLEEVSDVSRILLPTAANAKAAANVASSSSDNTTAISALLRKYDIVSLQPMNEPTLQNICEFLSPAVTISSEMTRSSPQSPQIDMIVLEYATGSRGGYGLPFRTRKDYVIKALEAGVTFELCYGTAILDPKRRQGFLRSLLDFQSAYSSIQKKRCLLLNKKVSNATTGTTVPENSNHRSKFDKFPLVLSSGPRQNYSQGTDEGIMALRSPHDIKCLVYHLVGGIGWMEKYAGGIIYDLGLEDDDEKLGGGSDSSRWKNSKRKKKIGRVVSAAERVLARARERRLGVVFSRWIETRGSNSGDRPMNRKRAFPGGMDARLYVNQFVVGEKSRYVKKIDRDMSEDESDDDNEDGGFSKESACSLVDWLSEPIKTMTDVEVYDGDNSTVALDTNETPVATTTVAIVEEKLVQQETNQRRKTDDLRDTDSRQEEDIHSYPEEDDDLEDGFMAL
mmetsp:Transcript_25446/g.53235  ORF Transcript_25446/g.53235 Transcript_25446/m.53235 type:complete len:598 (-) Transcript_25446:14-1807(-)